MSEVVIGFYDSTNYYNKIEKNAVYLIEQMKERGNKVLVFANEESPLSTALSEKSIPFTVIDKTKNYVNIVLSFRLAQAVKKEQCNVLIILRPHDLITAILSKVLFNRKLKLVFFQQIKFHLRKNYLLYSLLFKPFDAWIVSMENYRKQVIELSNYSERKVVHLPPGIDLDHYTNDTLSKNTARKILKLPGNIKLIGFLGRHHIKHRQDFLIRAIQLLRKHNYDVDLLVMGNSEDKSDKEYSHFLKELAVECGIEKYIHFRPYTEKEITFFKAIDIYTQITYEELNGNHILKAMASERPVIANDNEDISELLGKGKYGMLYHNGDIEDFTAKITRLLTQPKIRDYLVTEAKIIIYEKYDIRKRCEKFVSLIDQIISTR
jgi:glycosyltransferase involved in cell wall biosynthesis